MVGNYADDDTRTAIFDQLLTSRQYIKEPSERVNVPDWLKNTLVRNSLAEPDPKRASARVWLQAYAVWRIMYQWNAINYCTGAPAMLGII